VFTFTKLLLPRQRILRSLLLFLLFFIVVLIWARWRPAQRFGLGELRPGEFRLATWNVGYFALTGNKNARDVDIKIIVEVLKELSAQVAILQEVGSIEQANMIAQGLGENWQAIAVKTGHRGQVIAVLSRLSIGDVASTEAGGRRLIGVPLHDEDGHAIFIVGVHSPHPGRGMQDTIANIRGAVSMVAERKEPIRIIAGDFNYNFNADKTDSGAGSLYEEVLAFLSDSTASIGETYYAHTRIDHVFHYPKELTVINENSGMADLSLRFAKVPGFRDHRPIVITYDTGKLF